MEIEMATTELNPLAAAAAALAGRSPAKVTKRAAAPKNTRTVKDQGQNHATWERARALTVDIGGRETEIEKKYNVLADVLWILGVRPKDFDPIGKDAKGREAFSETREKIASWVVEGFPKHAAKLVNVRGAAVSVLTPEQKDIKSTWEAKIPKRMNAILKYLKRHEDLAEGRGPTPKSTLDQSLVKDLKKMIEKVKKADPDKVTFDAPRVIELMQDTIAELT